MKSGGRGTVPEQEGELQMFYGKNALRKRCGLSLFAALAIGGSIAACGDDDEDEGAKPKAARPAKLSVAVTELGGRRKRVTVPRSVRAGVVTVELRNTGRRPHSAQLIRFDGNHTPQEVLRLTQREGVPIPSWLHAAGGLGTVRPGRSATATQLLHPGNYIVLDQGDEEGGGRPAFARFRVTGGHARGALPRPAGTIVAREYSFTATGLRPGNNTIRFQNAGREPHHIVAGPLKPGATVEDVRKALEQERGEPPIDFERTQDTAVIDGRTSQTTQLEFQRPGRYALMCFIQDRKGGPPHVAKGMISVTTVR